MNVELTTVKRRQAMDRSGAPHGSFGRINRDRGGTSPSRIHSPRPSVLVSAPDPIHAISVYTFASIGLGTRLLRLTSLTFNKFSPPLPPLNISRIRPYDHYGRGPYIFFGVAADLTGIPGINDTAYKS